VAGGTAALFEHSLVTAVLVWPVVLAAAFVGLVSPALLTSAGRRRWWRAVRRSRRPLAAVGATTAVLATMGAAAVLPASPAVAQAGSCATAPQRVFNVAAINVEITVNRHGDNDPFGFMYVLEHNLNAVRDFEAKL